MHDKVTAILMRLPAQPTSSEQPRICCSRWFIFFCCVTESNASSPSGLSGGMTMPWATGGRAGGTWAGELWSTSSIVFGRRRQEEGSIRGLIRLRAAQWLRDSLSLRLLLSESREDELAKPSKERSALEGACFLAERWVVEVD